MWSIHSHLHQRQRRRNPLARQGSSSFGERRVSEATVDVAQHATMILPPENEEMFLQELLAQDDNDDDNTANDDDDDNNNNDKNSTDDGMEETQRHDGHWHGAHRQPDASSQPDASQRQQNFVKHVVLPEDTFHGICLRYKITPLDLRRANGGFSGTNLRLAPDVLDISLPQASFPGVQDTQSMSYKLQCLRNSFPTLDKTQAGAFLEAYHGDLELALQSLGHLCQVTGTG